MAIPFLATLLPSARLAFPHIQRGVTLGLSSRSITDALISQGLGIRRQTLLSIMRALKGQESVAARLSTMRPGFRPQPALLPRSMHPILRDFSFRVRLEGVDSLTGASVDRFITVSTDKLLTRAEIEDFAADLVTADTDRYPFVVERVQLVSGIRAA